MTVFGWDASHYDGRLSTAILARAKSEGIAFFTHKLGEGLLDTEGTFDDTALAAARAVGIPLVGGYVVPRSNATVASQVDAWIRLADSGEPWWRDFPGWFWQIDLERWPYDAVPASVGIAAAQQLREKTGRWTILYASRGQYGNSLTGWDGPLWNADYAGSAAYPGDSWSPGWAAYSGKEPTFLQYTSSATIAGLTTCDKNAFRGTTLQQLLDLTGGNDVSAHTDDVIARWAVGVDKAADGTPIAPVDWRIRDEAWQASVTASLTADDTRDAAMLAAIQGLAAGGGVDSAPIVAAVNAVRDEARTQFAALHDQLAAETAARQAAEARVAQLERDLAAAYSAAAGSTA